jgi:hypothetical protein
MWGSTQKTETEDTGDNENKKEHQKEEKLPIQLIFNIE